VFKGKLAVRLCIDGYSISVHAIFNEVGVEVEGGGGGGLQILYKKIQGFKEHVLSNIL
jgi:hypothetical protein